MAAAKKRAGSKTGKTSKTAKKSKKATGKLSRRAPSAPKVKRAAPVRPESEYIPQPPPVSNAIEIDAAHMPGHRKLDRVQVSADGRGEKVKSQESAKTGITKGDKINRVTGQKRISGYVASAGQRRRRSLQD